MNKDTNTELGHSAQPQLYDLKNDPGETKNLAAQYPDKVAQMHELLMKVKAGSQK
jgi:hypothetical protein